MSTPIVRSAPGKRRTERLLSFVLACAVCAASIAASARAARATPPYEIPEPWTYRALDKLAADGVLGDPRRTTALDLRPRTRQQAARLVARAVRRLQDRGIADASQDDLDTLGRLVHAYSYELALLGIRVDSVEDAVRPPDASEPVRAFHVEGAFAAEGAFRQRDTVPHNVQGGPIDPFVDAFLTSPPDDNPFEHDPGPGTLLRFDAKLSPTYTMNGNVSISVPIHVLEYDPAFTANDSYQVQPALVVNAARFGALRDVRFRAGTLDDLESSRLGLTYRAPDATQQGPGFQNPVQPYENGIELSARLGSSTHVQVAWSLIDQSAINTYAASPSANNSFLVVTPPQSSAVQMGTPSAVPGGTHTDTFVVDNAAVSSVALTQKAGLGTVYISAVDGTLCLPTGKTPSGGVCPIPPGSWYYIDQTNTVVFGTPLPVGTIVQITYGPPGSAAGGGFLYQYQREHVTARIDQRFTAVPGAEIGLSFSRIFDAGNAGASQGLVFGNGFGPESDTVAGFDARIPFGAVTLLGEAAFSKFSPDTYTVAPVTDTAAVLDLRFGVGGVTGDVTYQAVGPDFFDGGPLRYLGPQPDTFGYWRGLAFPGFFGFANDLAINQTFDRAVLPGCTGMSCTSRNAANTYAYPVFNPFVASGPQFYSAYAPNTRGFGAHVEVPLARGDDALRLFAQHLAEMVPDSIGQIEYGPGFASGVAMRFDAYGFDVTHAFRVGGRSFAFDLSASSELLTRNDKTAYAYVPFNVLSQSADAGATNADNAYLASGATPVLFYPNYVDERHTTIAPSLGFPLGPGLSARLVYNTQTYAGSYGTTRGQNISQRKTDAFATFTYALPRGTLDLVLGNQHYADAVLPSYDFSQNREALDYTVRF